jgi:coenzyme F420-0:L-glutamate ligase / coenzyme F420-1:gamma-L-glutamate ligase
MAADFRRDLVADGVPLDRIDAQIERSQTRIQSAPLVILLCMDMNGMAAYPDGRRAAAERSMAIQSVAAAGTQLLLAAHAEGLGGVWVCSPLFTPETLLKTLKLPADWEPQVMFFIGYPEEEPQPRERLPLQEISIFIR